MDKLFEVSTEIIKDMFNIFGIIVNALIDNIIFKILMGIVILFLLIELVFYLIKKIDQHKIDKPYKKALGMTRNEFTRQYNARVAEKFSYENKVKHLGLK